MTSDAELQVVFFGTQKDFSALKLESGIPGADENAMDIKTIDDAVAVSQEISKLGLQLVGDVSTHFYSKSMAFTRKTLMSNKWGGCHVRAPDERSVEHQYPENSLVSFPVHLDFRLVSCRDVWGFAGLLGLRPSFMMALRQA